MYTGGKAQAVDAVSVADSIQTACGTD
jgi:hypothetical protein